MFLRLCVRAPRNRMVSIEKSAAEKPVCRANLIVYRPEKFPAVVSKSTQMAEPSEPVAGVRAAKKTSKRSPRNGFNSNEKRALLVLSSLYALRMLGLFMIFPVFALYAEQLENSTPERMGLALGVYGLTQALLQIPFGMASDRFGRKPIIVLGLLLFAGGSVVAAVANSIEWVIVGRAIQGSGAIAAAISALVADVTRESQRTKAMAMVGASIGLSFVLALVLGPVLTGWVGVPGIFALTAVFAILAIPLLVFGVPKAEQATVPSTASTSERLRSVVGNADLRRLDVGIFCLHAMLTACFVVIPLVLRDSAGLPETGHWAIYLPVLLASLALMVPAMLYAERNQKVRPFFLGAVVMLGVSQLLLVRAQSWLPLLVMALVLFFVAFNFLEANLPSLISRIAPPELKGTAMGVYSSCQFLGSAVGGVLGGIALGRYGTPGVFFLCAGLALVWLAASWNMQPPKPRAAAIPVAE